MNANSRKMFKKSGLTVMLLIAMFLVVAQVSAAHMLCRSDPIVFLSNGTILRINAALETTVDDIVSVNYVIHAPANARIVKIIYAPSWAKEKEHVLLVNDQPANSYQIVTVAQTVTPNVATTITISKVSAGNGLDRKVASGITGQTIVIGF